MKIRLPYSLLIVTSAILPWSACTKHDTAPTDTEDLLTGYYPFYMFNQNSFFPPLFGDTISILYDSRRRPIKRIGGLYFLSSASGYLTSFTRNIYDTLIYNGDRVTMLTKSIPDSTSHRLVNENKTEMKMQGARILEKWQYISQYETDTFKYTYDADKLKTILCYAYVLKSRQDFYYNAYNNLDSIVTRYAYWTGEVTGWAPIDLHSNYRILEAFDNYDTVGNPIKNYMVFPELFNRSLSQNNYRSYFYLNQSEFEYKQGSVNFLLKYTDGKVDFSKY